MSEQNKGPLPNILPVLSPTAGSAPFSQNPRNDARALWQQALRDDPDYQQWCNEQDRRYYREMVR